MKKESELGAVAGGPNNFVAGHFGAVAGGSENKAINAGEVRYFQDLHIADFDNSESILNAGISAGKGQKTNFGNKIVSFIFGWAKR